MSCVGVRASTVCWRSAKVSAPPTPPLSSAAEPPVGAPLAARTHTPSVGADVRPRFAPQAALLQRMCGIAAGRPGYSSGLPRSALIWPRFVLLSTRFFFAVLLGAVGL